VAVARERCLYCGALLEAPAAPRAADTAGPPAAPGREGEAPAARTLVLLDLGSLEADALAPALALSRYEAGLLARRGGLHLVRAAAEAEAEREAKRLRGLGLAPLVVPETEVRAAPLACVAGERRGDALLLRGPAGAALTLERGDALIVVSGPIAREYLPSLERRRIATASLAEGFLVHVHRRSETRPLEIDALNFELGFAAAGSVRLELDAWLEAVAGEAPRDTGFARLPPVLAPAAAEPASALAAAGSLAAAARGAGREARASTVLDNVAQFRFYSGCLAAAARRRG
jgi:hypothetical protein